MSSTDERMVRIAEIEIEPAALADYLALLKEEIESSVAKEPGVLMLHAVSLRDEPASIRILEVYASRQAYEAHIQTPHFLKYKLGTANMVRSLRLLETDPVALAGKTGPV